MDFTMLKEYLDKITHWRIPGAAVMVFKDGKEVYKYASGYSDVENKIPMTCNETVNVYSCSKVVTCVAAMQLLERGVFLLNDPLYDFIPDFREMYVRDENGEIKKTDKPITMRHLFTMSAGFNYNLENPGFIKAKELTNGKMNTLTAIKCLAAEPLDFEPGTRWQYSLCHDVLAAAVEVISGMEFGEYVQKNIFDPLGIKNATYKRTDEVKSRISQQYTYVPEFNENKKLITAGDGGYWENIGKDVEYAPGIEYESGGAGLVISFPDYAKFGDALAHFGKCPNGERILSKGGVELMRQDQLQPCGIKGYNWAHLGGTGYGLGVRTMVNTAVGGSTGPVGEFGWDGAGGCLTVIDPDNEFSVFYGQHMTNSQGPIVKARVRNVAYACMNI